METKKNSYHNTNKEDGATLFNSNKAAENQEQQILDIFKTKGYNNITPEFVQACYFPNTPLTSIRRAFSNLADPSRYNAIEKSEVMVMGNYGKKVHTWNLKGTSDEKE